MVWAHFRERGPAALEKVRRAIRPKIGDSRFAPLMETVFELVYFLKRGVSRHRYSTRHTQAPVACPRRLRGLVLNGGFCQHLRQRKEVEADAVWDNAVERA